MYTNSKVKYEKTQVGNPHELTINQHIFPKRSIDRFTKSGIVCVYIKQKNKIINITPNNKLFCVERLWNESCEHGLMYRIESEFQRLVEDLLKNPREPSEEEFSKISKFWALWQMRSETKHNPLSDIKNSAIIDYQHLSKNEEEILEKNGYSFLHQNVMPARHANSLKIHLGILLWKLIPKDTKWGIIYSPDVEFVVPDTFNDIGVIPISPNFCFVANSQSGQITESNAIAINKDAIINAKNYYFAREFSKTGI